MANINKQLKFEGNKYNLGNKDRVAAAAAGAGGRSNVSVAFADGAGSIAGDATAGVITVGTQSTSGNDITVTFADVPERQPVCVFNAVGVTNFTLVESATGFALDVSGNTGTGTVSYICM